ncbi:hypothetical protein O203_20500 [Ectopseudomonas chengduensis]|nr:hypothetical protein O203_20500 [Pseudomonas chengduensis]
MNRILDVVVVMARYATLLMEGLLHSCSDLSRLCASAFEGSDNLLTI